MPDDRLDSQRELAARARGVIPFVWVQDDDTGHRYDVPETSLRDGMTPVKDYPLNITGMARPTKYRDDIAAETKSSKKTTSAELKNAEVS